MSTYGKGRVELITPCVQLADANVGLHRFGKAADVLALAQWCIVQNPECNHALRSRMHRSMGLLYAAQGKHEAALRHLAQDVYHSALEVRQRRTASLHCFRRAHTRVFRLGRRPQVGPEHIDTSGGYYAMAGVFYESNQIENALAFYDKVRGWGGAGDSICADWPLLPLSTPPSPARWWTFGISSSPASAPRARRCSRWRRRR